MKAMTIKTVMILMGIALIFSLSACKNDGKNGENSLESLLVTVPDDVSPVANAGEDQSVEQGTPVRLDGSESDDEDGQIVSYAWQLPDGTAVGSDPILDIGVLPVGAHTFVLVVTDDRGATGVDTVDITVTAPPPEPAPVAEQNPEQQVAGANEAAEQNQSADECCDNPSEECCEQPEECCENPPAPTPTPTPTPAGLGIVSGTIIDAVSGSGIANVTLNAREGANTQTGNVIRTITGGANGHYSIEDLAAGTYTLEAIANGYIIAYFTVTSVADHETGNQDHTLSPIVPQGQTRIVLTWSPQPDDLDSHLTGPDGAGGTFHVYFDNRSEGGASLDLDDTNGNGPETVTITVQNAGDYLYYVHNYSSGSIDELANSNAKVEVYRGSSLIRTYNVPNGEGYYWTVFSMDGDTITPINTIEASAP